MLMIETSAAGMRIRKRLISLIKLRNLQLWEKSMGWNKDEEIDLDDVRDVDDAPPDVQATLFAQMREALRLGNLTFGPGVEEAMKEDGITQEDIIAMLMEKIGRDG